ncbi:MAG TPA: ATP-binding protein, partial [Methanocorpusculum sp.]|nr:ATP-binding protein [Methanocorpusculum sp.]
SLWCVCMLIRFRVSNYLSFDESQEFTTYKGRTRNKTEHVIPSGKLSLLKFSAIYGANASGKSNLVQAMADSQRIIVTGIPSPELGKCYFKINEENKLKPSTFEYEFEIGGAYYAYGFDVVLAEGKIVGEWLYRISPGKNEELIFKRQPLDEEHPFEIGPKYTNQDLKTYINGMKTNTMNLFLQDINFGKQDLFRNNPKLFPLQDAYRWFVEKLVITMPGEHIRSLPFFLQNNYNTDLANKIIPSLGLGIETVEIRVENSENYQKILPADVLRKIADDAKGFVEMQMRVSGKRPEQLGLSLLAPHEFLILELDPGTFEIKSLKRLQFRHAGNLHTIFDYAEESDGTRIMLNLVEVLFAAHNGSDTVFIFDELDRGLHPLLSHRFVELFLTLSKGTTQLIATTHETHLMDLDMLRQDEIWMITKHSDGHSGIMSLDQYNVRFDKKLAKGYLGGLYGGIPLIDTFTGLEYDEGGK